jgi:hypothetical protein
MICEIGASLASFFFGRALNAAFTKAAHRCTPIGNVTIGTPMAMSLSEAATAIGMYKSSVLRAIKAGKISATKDEHGEWRIEPAESHRVYPPVASNEADKGATERYAPLETTLALRAELAEQRLADLKLQLDDMREQRDKWQAQAEWLACPCRRSAAVVEAVRGLKSHLCGSWPRWALGQLF